MLKLSFYQALTLSIRYSLTFIFSLIIFPGFAVYKDYTVNVNDIPSTNPVTEISGFEVSLFVLIGFFPECNVNQSQSRPGGRSMVSTIGSQSIIFLTNS